MSEDGIEIKVADAPRPFREQLIKVGLTTTLGRERFYLSVKDAVDDYERQRESLSGKAETYASGTIDAY